VVRHRLNRGGDRDANRALHLICVVRMRHDQRTKEYVARGTAEGKSKREIIRCLKRYIARETYRLLAPIAAASPPPAPGSQAA
jgi:transposase